jgi:hypothetical protein
MEMEVRKYPINWLIHRYSQIDSEVWYQRQKVWSTKDKRLFIDSLLRGYTLPFLYFFQQTSFIDDEERFEVIDGKQRLETIHEFWQDKFALGKESTDMGLEKKKYGALSQKYRDKFFYSDINFVVVKDTLPQDPKTYNPGKIVEEVTDLFQRLQKGKRLTSPEVLNSIKGNMRNFCAGIAGIERNQQPHDLFKKINLSRSRYALLQVTAQITFLVMKGMRDAKFKDLSSFFKERKDFDENSEEAKRIRKLFKILDDAFTKIENSAFVDSRASLVSIALLFEYLMDGYAIEDKKRDIATFFIKFLERVRQETKKDSQSERDTVLLDYNSATIQAADSSVNIRKRFEILKERLFQEITDIRPKDPIREFIEDQRKTIYARDNGICWHCLKKVEWSDYQADHRPLPHSKAGPTTVENGVAAHTTCNIKVSNKIVKRGSLAGSD